MPTGDQLLFAVNVDTRGLVAQVLINGVTVYANRGKQATFAEKINPLLVPQGNSVAVTLALPPPPVEAVAAARLAKPDPPQFRLTVQRGTPGTDPGEAGELLKFAWSGQPPLSGTAVEVFRGTFDASDISWRPRWISLPPVQAGRAELERFVTGFAENLRAREVDRLLALHSLKFHELADSLGLDFAQMSESFRRFLRRLMDDATWNVLPVDATKLLYVSEAGGRMVRITSASGEPPIMTRGSAGEVPFNLTVARADGELQIAR